MSLLLTCSEIGDRHQVHLGKRVGNGKVVGEKLQRTSGNIQGKLSLLRLTSRCEDTNGSLPTIVGGTFDLQGVQSLPTIPDTTHTISKSPTTKATK